MDSRKGTAVAAAALDKKMPADTSSTFSSQEQTVEEYLKAHCSQLVGDLNAHAEGLIKNLQEELEKGKAEILALAQDNNALAPAAVQPPSSDSSTDASSGGAATSYSHPRPAEAAAAAASAPPTVPAYQTIILHVKEGPYASCTFKLIQSKARKEFIIGRSTGKKVKDHGVSLPQDPEVSTVHGRVEVRGNGNIVFEDLGSTNGSFINSISLEERVPQVLRTDDVLKCGGTIMTVELQQQGEAQ
ncbi:signal peptide protein [Nannochloropsis oceanica]